MEHGFSYSRTKIAITIQRDGRTIAGLFGDPSDESEETARRIIAAVNATEGIETELLETGVNLKSQINDALNERNKAYEAVMSRNAEIERLQAQNTRLLEALENLLGTFSKPAPPLAEAE